MLNIYASNTYKNAASYIAEQLNKANPARLEVRHIVIVPDRASLSAEELILNSLKAKGSFNTEVLTLRRYANKLLPKLNYLSKQSAVMALMSVVTRLKKDFLCFKKGVDNLGFIESVYEIICNLKYSSVAPKQLLEKEYPKALNAKMHDIALIYQEYQRFLEGGYVDSAAKLDLLISAIEKDPFVPNNCYYFFDFESMTKQELSIICALLKRGAKVTAAIAYSQKPFHKHLYLEDVYEGLLWAAEQSGAEVDIKKDYSYPDDFSYQIGEGLWTYNKLEALETEKGRLSFYALADKEQEVCALADDICRHIRKGGKYGDYHCVTSDLNKYLNTFNRIFPQYGIPYFTGEKSRLTDHPLAQFLLDYFIMFKNNFKREYVFNFVKNYYFEGGEEVFAFENYCLKYNASYNFSSFKLGREDKTVDYAAAENIRQKLKSVIDLREIKSVDRGENYLDAAYNLIETCFLEEKTQKLYEECVAKGMFKHAKLTSQAVKKVKETLEEFAALLSKEVFKLEDFIKILSAGFMAKSVSVLPLSRDCVVITNMDKARNHQINKLALLGAAQGELPIIERDVKLLSDKNLQLLKEIGIDLTGSVYMQNKRERFSLYQLLLDAKSLFVSCSLTAGDKGSLPSDFYLQLLKLFKYKNGAAAPQTFAAQEIFTQKRGVLKAVTLNSRVENKMLIYQNDYSLLKEKYKGEIEKYSLKPSECYVKNGKKLFFKKEESSISKTECFYNCPMQHFFRYGLELKEREKAQLDPRVFGLILHEVLDAYVKRLEKSHSEKEAQSLIANCFNEVMQRDYYLSIATDESQKTTIRLLKEECIILAKSIKKQLDSSDFTPLATEWRFGSGHYPFAIERQGRQHKLTGVIDRIDAGGGYFYCIDYKSGNADFGENKLYAGRKLQLLLYLEAVKRATGLIPAGFYYLPLKDEFSKDKKRRYYEGRTLSDEKVVGKIDKNFITYGKSQIIKVSKDKGGALKGDVLSKEELEGEIRYALLSLWKSGELMEKGYIKASPLNEGGMGDACTFCPFGDICKEKDVRGEISRALSKKVTAQDILDTVNDYEKR